MRSMRTLLFLVSLTTVWAATPLDGWLSKPEAERGAVPDVSLTRAEAEEFRDTVSKEMAAKLKDERSAEFAAKEFTVGENTLKWLEKDFGNAADGKRSLWISMHGGGSGPAAMNDGQWRNQIRLYQPEEGIYVAPRAPTNSWNMWHQDHIDVLFDRLITDMIVSRGVDPNRVYLMGYSAGGDGVWQLAPRMADRFAAAAMMAGHPNEASLLGLRNLPFAIFVGGADAAYDRNKIDAQKGVEMDALRKADPEGYEHFVRIYEGLPHWMNGKDAEALPWMRKFSRNPWPKKIVWFQDDVTHDRFYWLELPTGTAKAGQKIVATVEGNRISLEGDVPSGIRLLLSDALVDLDKQIEVTLQGKTVFQGKVERKPETILSCLKERFDTAACATAEVRLKN